MKRIRRLLEPEAPRSIAGPVLGAVLLLAPLAASLLAGPQQTPPQTPPPNAADAQFQSGVTNLAAKKYKEAENAFRRSYELDPASTRALLGVVETYMEQGMTDPAIQLLQSESAKTPGRMELHKALGDAELRAGLYAQALAEFHTVLASTPTGSTAQGQLYLKIGDANRRKGDLAAAIDAFQQALKILPGNVAALNSLGITLNFADRWPEARQVYEAVLKLDPNNAVAMNNLAFGLAEHNGDLDQAFTLAQQAKRIQPDLIEASDTLGWIYLKKNLPADALPIFQDLAAKQPGLSTRHYHLGMAFAQAGDRPHAATELAKALACHPPDGEKKKIQDLLNTL
jgi:tetratricopeptide (TPR) repeat protein